MSILELNKLKSSERKIKLFDITKGFDKYIVIDLINETYDEVFDVLSSKYDILLKQEKDTIYLSKFYFREIEYFNSYYDVFEVSTRGVIFEIDELSEINETEIYFNVIRDLESILLDKHLDKEQRKIFDKCYYLDNKEEIIFKKLKWKGSQTALMELSKAMIEAKLFDNKQKDVVDMLSLLFDTKINNPDKLIQDIKKRNNGSETLLLDTLKSSLVEFINN